MRAWRLSLGLVLTSGCLSSAEVDWASLEPGATAVLWSATAGALVVDLQRPPGASALPDGGPLFAVTYPWTPAQLGLRPGPLAFDDADPLAPSSPRAFEARRDAGRLTFAASEDATREAAGLRLPGLDDRRCVEEGGCRPSGGDPVCVTPCPASAGVARPTAPRLECPTGWRTLPSEGLGGASWCEPPLPEPSPSCSENETAWWSDQGCAPVDDCPETPFRAVAGPALYVLEGAAGGDGSIDDPFSDLPAALAAVGHDGTIVLGPGTYASGPLRHTGLRVVGHCAARTRVISPGSGGTTLQVNGAGGHISHLFVQGVLRAVATATVSAVAVQGNLRVTQGAEVTARRVWLQGGETHRIQIDGGSRLVMTDLATVGGLGVDCRTNSQLRLRGAWLRDAQAAALLSSGCDRFEVEDVLAEGGDFPALRVKDASGEVFVRNLAARDLDDTAVVLRRPDAAPDDPLTRVQITGLYARAADQAVNVFGAFDLTLRKVVGHELTGFVVSALTSPGPTMQVEVAEVWATSTGGVLHAKRFERGAGAPSWWSLHDAVSQDAHLTDVPATREGMLRITDGVRVHVERVYLTGEKPVGVLAHESEVRLEDVVVMRPGLDGFDLRTVGQSEATRIAVHEARGIGVVIGASVEASAPLSIRDLEVSTSRPAQRGIVGLQSRADAAVEVQRFRISEVEVGVETRGSTRLQDGLLTGCEIGLRLVEGASLEGLTSGVQVACERPIEP